MAELQLAIEQRESVGTQKARSLRREGKVPGIIYGHGSQPKAVAFEARALGDLLHNGGRTSLITLTMQGRRYDTALVREVQIDPVSRRIIHVDLQLVSADETVHAKLPIVTIGTPAGVRDAGGVMDVITHEIEVEGPANKLPENIEIDVSALGIHEHINASDLKLPAEFKLITPPDAIVIAVEPSKTERQLEEAEVAAAAPPEQLEPELVGKPEEEPAPAEGTPE